MPLKTSFISNGKSPELTSSSDVHIRTSTLLEQEQLLGELACCLQEAGGPARGHTARVKDPPPQLPAECGGNKNTDHDPDQLPPLLGPGDVRCAWKEGVGLSSASLYSEGDWSNGHCTL